MILEAKNIHKSYGEKILKGINLSIDNGQTIAIMGASGEGKTTLLHILGTLEKADKGSLHFLGRRVLPSFFNNLRNQHIGFIFQSFHLLEDFSTLENALMPARIAKQPAAVFENIYQKTSDLLDAIGLKDRKHHPAKILSGGEKQRVAIVRALCNDPDLIIADEPSGNLDHFHSKQIHALLIDSAKESKKALIIATHDESLAKLCDEIYLLEDGFLIKQDHS